MRARARSRRLAVAILMTACGSRSDLTLLAPANAPQPAAPSNGSCQGLADLDAVTAEADPDFAQGPNARFEPGPQRVDHCELAPASLDRVLSWALADLLAQPEGSRPFLRYVSAQDVAGGLCDADLAQALLDEALPLIVNGASTDPEPAVAVSVPGARGLWRLDLRALGWDSPVEVARLDDAIDSGSGSEVETEHADGWEALRSRAAAAVELEGPEADALARQTGSPVPLLASLDFVHAVLDGDVYYGLLGAPASLAALQQSLGLSAECAATPHAFWWAGVDNSVVSRSSRGLRRFRGAPPSPLYWEALDYAIDTALPGVQVAPLDMAADGRAVLYGLPNGLLGYYLADAEGRRTTSSSILLDTLEDDFRARPPASCGGCHAQGPAPFTDLIGPRAAANPGGHFSDAEVDAVFAAYPRQTALDALIAADAERVAQARARAGVSERAVDAVSRLDHFADAKLKPPAVGGALYVSEATLRERRQALPPALRVALTLGGMERRDLLAVYLEAACVLHAEARNRPAGCPPR